MIGKVFIGAIIVSNALAILLGIYGLGVAKRWWK